MSCKSVTIQFIPHAAQRYETCGDWETANGAWTIRVSDLGNWKFNLLVAIHELIEMALCVDRGISEQVVTDFDLQFEAARAVGHTDEPGDAPGAPYRAEHQFATGLEHQMADALQVDWGQYEDAIQGL